MPAGFYEDIVVGMSGDMHHARSLKRNALLAAQQRTLPLNDNKYLVEVRMVADANPSGTIQNVIADRETGYDPAGQDIPAGLVLRSGIAVGRNFGESFIVSGHGLFLSHITK